MSIASKGLKRKQGNIEGAARVLMGPGNIIPNWWYREVQSAGKPDLVGITILSELLYLYRKNAELECSRGYIYFERKFHFTRYQLQEAGLRLHNNQYVIRSFRTVTVNGRKHPNELHLRLNVDYLNKLSPYFPSDNDTSSDGSDHNSFEDQDDVSFYHKDILENFDEKPTVFSEDHNSNKRAIYKNRSIKANSSEENSGSNIATVSACNANQKFTKAQYLSDFVINQEDCLQLQQLSGRRFSLNAMNEILLSIARKVKEQDRSVSFYSKRGFMAYMAKSLKNELRDAVAISNRDFRINSNISLEEKEIEQRELYLEKIENTQQIDNESTLQKKLAATLSASNIMAPKNWTAKKNNVDIIS